ncbi:MAG: glycosyltransferase family 2 protein [Mobilitalea sp.]
MEKVSVIIPIYNVEKYLKKCIDSVLDQTYANLEIILVDDGSPDHSGAICDDYAKHDLRINVIHKANAGLGFARNSGLEEVTGTYVVYVDSDDWLDNRAIETMVLYAELYNADMVICGFNKYSNERNWLPIKAANEIRIYSDKEDIVRKILYPIIDSDVVKKGSDSIEMSVCTNLYKAQIIKDNQIKFVSEREYLTEDFFYNVDYIMKTRRVVIAPDCLYYYRYNNNSLSKAYRPQKIMLLKKMTQEAYKVLDEYGVLEGVGHRLEKAYLKRLRKCLMLIESCDSLNLKQKINEYYKVVNNSFTQHIVYKYPLLAGPLKETILVLLIKNKLYIILMLYLKIQRIILSMIGRR